MEQVEVRNPDKVKQLEAFCWLFPHCCANEPRIPGCCVTAVKFSGVLPGPGRFLMHRSPHCQDGGKTVIAYSMSAGKEQGIATHAGLKILIRC